MGIESRTQFRLAPMAVFIAQAVKRRGVVEVGQMGKLVPNDIFAYFHRGIYEGSAEAYAACAAVATSQYPAAVSGFPVHVLYA